MKKKKVAATALAVGLAAVLALGGSFAYFQDSSEEVVNTIQPNYNSVSLKETDVDGDDDEQSNTYEIVPGTTDTKDPVATVNYTLDSYVYLVMDETASEWVDFSIDTSVWTQLTGYTNVWYALVTTGDDGNYDSYTTASGNGNVTVYKKELNVLTDSIISYRSSLTNEDMFQKDDQGNILYDTEGNPLLIEDLTIEFQAYIMQADIVGSDGDALESALACWNVMMAGQTDNPVTVTPGNVEVTVDTSGAEEVVTTKNDLVVTSEDSSYTATVPAGVTIDTTTADIVTDAGGTTTTTLVLVVEEVGSNYSDSSLSILGTQTAVVYDISIIGVSEDNTTVMEIALNVGSGLDIDSVQHEGSPLTALTKQPDNSSDYEDDRYYYDDAKGILYIYTDTFSEFAVIRNYPYPNASGETGYDTLEEAVEDGCVAINTTTNVVYELLNTATSKASEGDTIQLIADAVIPVNHYADVSKSMTIDLNGYDITHENLDTGIVFQIGSTSKSVTAVIRGSGDSTITAGKYAISVKSNTSTDLTVSNVAIIAKHTSSVSTTAGGGILFLSSKAGTKLTVDHVTIDTSVMEKGGCAIYSAAETASINDVDITAGSYGIYTVSGTTTVTESRISRDNSLLTTSTYAIRNESGAIMTVSDTTVTNANSYAIYNYKGTMTVQGDSVITGTASSSDFGVGICNKDASSVLTVTGGTITGVNGIKADGTVTIGGNTVVTGTEKYGMDVSKNCTLEVNDQAKISGVTVGIYSSGGNVTINGGTVSAASDSFGQYYPLGIRSLNSSSTRATLTITGGTITGGNSGIYATGTDLTITGGTIIGTGLKTTGENVSGYGRGVYVTGTNANSAVTVVISGGTISGHEKSNSLYVTGSYCSCSVSAGSFDGKLTVTSAGTLSIAGGIFDSTFSVTSPGKLTITGGSFTANPSDYVDTDLYTVTATDGVYTVTAAASETETESESETEA